MSLPNETHNEGGPAGLVGSPESFAGFGVEIFVEENVIIPERVASVGVVDSNEVTGPVRTGHEELDESVAKIDGDLAQGGFFAGAGGVFDGKVVTIKIVVALESLDEDEVGWEPNRSAPIRVATKHFGGRFTRGVLHAVSLPVRFKVEGFLAMSLAERANAEVGEKFIPVKHAGQGGAKLVLIGNGDEPAIRVLNARNVLEFDILHDVRAVLHKPLHPALEVGKGIDLRLLQDGRSHDGEKSYQRSCLEGNGVLSVDDELVVVEAVFFIPKPAAAEGIDGVANLDVVLEKF